MGFLDTLMDVGKTVGKSAWDVGGHLWENLDKYSVVGGTAATVYGMFNDPYEDVRNVLERQVAEETAALEQWRRQQEQAWGMQQGLYAQQQEAYGLEKQAFETQLQQQLKSYAQQEQLYEQQLEDYDRQGAQQEEAWKQQQELFKQQQETYGLETEAYQNQMAQQMAAYEQQKAAWATQQQLFQNQLTEARSTQGLQEQFKQQFGDVLSGETSVANSPMFAHQFGTLREQKAAALRHIEESMPAGGAKERAMRSVVQQYSDREAQLAGQIQNTIFGWAAQLQMPYGQVGTEVNTDIGGVPYGRAAQLTAGVPAAPTQATQQTVGQIGQMPGFNIPNLPGVSAGSLPGQSNALTNLVALRGEQAISPKPFFEIAEAYRNAYNKG